jgi:hypothetical protein
MNERIKSLLVECGAELVKGTHNGRTGTAVNLPVGRMFDFEKFAELIVRECITVIENKMPDFTCKEDYENLIRKAGRMDAIDEIEQHFGVEQ